MPYPLPNLRTVTTIHWLSISLILMLASPVLTADQDNSDQAFWQSVYKENHVLEIDLSLKRDAWEAMQPVRGQGRGDKGAWEHNQSFPYARAQVTVDGKPFKDAGLRFKGNSSYNFASRGLKRPFKLDTNRFVKGQKLHGRTKINLSNAFLDSAYMKEKLAYELYSAAGMPTPGIGWAVVTLSVEGLVEKKELGLYVVIEQVDNRFITGQLGNASDGSLLMKPETGPDWYYPGNDLSRYAMFGIKQGEENEDQIKQFGAFLKLIKQAHGEEFLRVVGEKMDLQQFAGYLAATCILSNIDSYIGMPHNYYLLMDKADGTLKMLPWDLNEAFGTFTMGTPPETLADWNIDRPWVLQIPLLERLFSTQGFQELYRTAIRNLMRDHFTEEKLFARITTFEKALRPHLQNTAAEDGLRSMRMGIEGDTSGFNKAVPRRILAIKPFIRQRIRSIEEQLTGNHKGQTLQSRHEKRPPPGRNGKRRGRPRSQPR